MNAIDEKNRRGTLLALAGGLHVWGRYRVELMDITHLIPHEDVRPGRVAEMLTKIRRRNFFHKPILIDQETGAILDGHHKWTAAVKMGLRRVPVVAVDYLKDERIRVETGEGAGEEVVTKESVILAALRGRRFPPKSSHHLLPSPLPRLEIPISELLFPIPEED